jgi:ketosteroid isomerase-like protein
MKTLASIVLCLFSFIASILADPKAEEALCDADDQGSKGTAAHDLDKTVSFYASDAIVLPPNQAAITAIPTYSTASAIALRQQARSEKIRQQLQVLRDSELLIHVSRGRWRIA